MEVNQFFIVASKNPHSGYQLSRSNDYSKSIGGGHWIQKFIPQLDNSYAGNRNLPY